MNPASKSIHIIDIKQYDENVDFILYTIESIETCPQKILIVEDESEVSIVFDQSRNCMPTDIQDVQSSEDFSSFIEELKDVFKHNK